MKWIFATRLKKDKNPNSGKTNRPDDELLEDLENIVREPPPALGAPAGVSLPLYMSSEAVAAEQIRRGATHGHSRRTRTTSSEIVGELHQVLAAEQNHIWRPKHIVLVGPAQGQPQLKQCPQNPGCIGAQVAC